MAVRSSRSLLNKWGHILDKSQKRLLNNHIGVVGIPFGKGQKRPGVQLAPQALRDGGLITKLTMMGYSVHDYGDMEFEHFTSDPPSYTVKNPRTVGAATHLMSKAVSQVIRDGRICLSLGGDHALSIGTIHGHCQVEPQLALVWVDAHADINTPLSSMTGNIHGMPLSFLVKELVDYVPPVDGFDWLTPCLSAKDIAFIGLRDIDPGERYIMDSLGMTVFTMHEIDKIGIQEALRQAIKAVNPNLDRPMHLSYDIDALDPGVSPSTGTAVPGGLTIREGMFIAEELAKTGTLSGIDLVEVNPELGSREEQNLTLFTATELMAACFGKRRKGNLPLNYKLPFAKSFQKEKDRNVST